MFTASRLITRTTPTLLRNVTRYRTYATEISADTGNFLSLSLVVPHAPIFSNKPVNLVTVPGASGYMGIAKNHVPVIAELKPGVVTVDEPGKSEKYFISGGFAFVNPDKTCFINAVEAIPLEQLDSEAVKKGLQTYSAEFASATEPEAKAKAQVSHYILKTISCNIIKYLTFCN